MLYAIGDTHLSLETDKPMDIFGGWDDYIERLEAGFSCLCDGDVCVICGDISWGMSLEKCTADFKFLDKFPGKKIILKGNHDYWWSTVSKAQKFFAENNIKSISFLNNNCYFYGNTAICGTRGWFYEEETGGEHDKKILRRELMRLETSLKAAGDAERKLCFLHYPPLYNDYVCPEMIELMKKYGVSECWYGHIHGPGRKLAVERTIDGISYHLVSADHIGFKPQKIME